MSYMTNIYPNIASINFRN